MPAWSVLVVVGELRGLRDAQEVRWMCNTLGWPCLCDSLGDDHYPTTFLSPCLPFSTPPYSAVIQKGSLITSPSLCSASSTYLALISPADDISYKTNTTTNTTTNNDNKNDNDNDHDSDPTRCLFFGSDRLFNSPLFCEALGASVRVVLRLGGSLISAKILDFLSGNTTGYNGGKPGVGVGQGGEGYLRAHTRVIRVHDDFHGSIRWVKVDGR